MEYLLRMDVCDSIEDLLDDDFDFFFIWLVLFIGDELFEVEVRVVEHNFKFFVFCFIGDVEERDDVGMFSQCF